MEAKPRRSWRQHPLLKRLPFLLLAALGLWLWQSGEVPERTLVWRLEGPGWSEVQGLEFQLVDSSDTLLKREERFFGSPPPSQVELKARLPEGTYTVRIFPMGAERKALGPPRVETLTVGEEAHLERTLRR